MVALMAVNFAWLAVQLFGGSYQANANVYFPGFEQMAARAAEIQAETGEKINVTGNVYPHIQPSDGAEMMFLYATDADMRTAEAERGTRYETIYVSDDMQRRKRIKSTLRGQTKSRIGIWKALTMRRARATR